MLPACVLPVFKLTNHFTSSIPNLALFLLFLPNIRVFFQWFFSSIGLISGEYSYSCFIPIYVRRDNGNVVYGLKDNVFKRKAAHHSESGCRAGWAAAIAGIASHFS
jgi:hypothetical protein